MASIGFIGLGAMGLPMAKRACEAGHAVKVAVHKNPAPAREIATLGGTIVADITEVVSGVDAIVSILPGDEQIAGILLAPAVAEAIAPGTLLLEMSTASPTLMRSVAAFLEPKGVAVLDAPVSGGVRGATEGSLTIICGGKTAVYEAALPLLRTFGAKFPLVGGVGDGKALKAVNQLLVAVNTIAVAEALALARNMGVDPASLRDVVSSSSGNSAAFANKFTSMVANDFSPRFTATLMRKDVDIALAEAAGIDLPLAELARRLYRALPPDADCLDYSVIAQKYAPK